MIVFSYSIRYLKDHLLEKLFSSNLGDKVTVDDINFVLTVPAIWDDTAKMFMREAAIEVRVEDIMTFLQTSSPIQANKHCSLTLGQLIQLFFFFIDNLCHYSRHGDWPWVSDDKA